MSEMSLGRRLLAGWNAIVGRFGFAQTLVILSIFYTLIIGPASLVMERLLRNDLLDRRGLGDEGSAWRAADSAASDLERAKRTF